MRLKNSNFHEMKINDKLIRLHPGLGEIGVCVGGTDGCGGTRQDQGLSGFSLGVLGWRVFIVTGGGGGGGGGVEGGEVYGGLLCFSDL